MQIKRIAINNYRCISEIETHFDEICALVGPNNAGKSTILKAIDLFFTASPKILAEDFIGRSEDKDIEISIVFDKLTPSEVSEFASAMKDGELTVTRIFSRDSSRNGIYDVTAPSNPQFSTIRDETDGRRRNSLYSDLRKQYGDLPEVSRHTEIDAALRAWEASHSEETRLQRIRGFFGAPNVANGKLRKRTQVVYVPAVKEASSEISEGKSPIIQLLSTISQQVFQNKSEIQDFVNSASEEFSHLTNPDEVSELHNIGPELTRIVSQYYSDSEIITEWSNEAPLQFNFPKPKIYVKNKEFVGDIDRMGHGLQRAALFAVIQYLAMNRTQEQENPEENLENFIQPASDIILLIEEPEAFQHPIKQNLFRDRFMSLVKQFSLSTGIRFQILFTTHSEKLISMQDFDNVRVIRINNTDGEISNQASFKRIEDCRDAFAEFTNKTDNPMEIERFRASFHIFSRELCEGFFAERIILVEGASDKAALHAAFLKRGQNPDEDGVAIISTNGKTLMDKPLYIFRSLGIPCYPVFDNDKKKSADKQSLRSNHLIQRVLGIEQVEDFPVGVFDEFAVFDENLEKFIRSTLGEKFTAIKDRLEDHLGVNYDSIKKTPYAVAQLMVFSEEEGITFEPLHAIIENALRER